MLAKGLPKNLALFGIFVCFDSETFAKTFPREKEKGKRREGKEKASRLRGKTKN